MKLLIASNNKHKINEFVQILNVKYKLGLEILLPEAILGTKFQVEETGNTFKENALIKAIALYRQTKIPCFADDSGLMIDALNGEPGVHSARYFHNEPNDANNRKKVLDSMKNVQTRHRTARFVANICYTDDNGGLFFEGICEGKITTEERGNHGFGYDPIFIPNGYEQTFAEMDTETKNSISHRAIATQKFAEFLKM